MSSFYNRRDERHKSSQPINQFGGYYEFLSIDYSCQVYFEGFLYRSVSMAFQAARTNNIHLRRKISEVTDQTAFKQLTTEIKNSPDWNQKRLSTMTKLNRDKFKRNKELGLKLLATQSRELVNGYEKGGDAQAFWGMVLRNGQYEGLNTLGKIVATIREDIKLGRDSRRWIEDQNVENDENLWPEANLIVEKQGDEVDNLVLASKNIFLIGQSDNSDFQLQHGSISKSHAAIYFSTNMEIILVDLNSTHGTAIIRRGQTLKLEPLRPQSLENKDILKFGFSSRNYTCFFSYDQVEKRISEKQQKEREEIQKIEKLKDIQSMKFQDEQQQREAIKALLELKDYACLYVQGIDRGYSYQSMRELFNRYGAVKNVRCHVEQKTGRFMGSALIYYQQGHQISGVLDNIAKDSQRDYTFRIKAVSSFEAQQIIASFTNKKIQPLKPATIEIETVKQEGRTKQQPRNQKKRPKSRSRSRDRKKRRYSPSSSSDSRRHKKKKDRKNHRKLH